MEFRITNTFIDSLLSLTLAEQKQVKRAVFELIQHLDHPSLQFHRLDRCTDPNFWSARVNGEIRIVIHRLNADLLLCYVDHHDAAYRWADRHKIDTHEALHNLRLEVLDPVDASFPRYVWESPQYHQQMVEIVNLNDKIDLLQTQLELAQTQLQSEQKLQQALDEDLQKLQAELDHAKAELQGIQHQRQPLEQEVRSLREQLRERQVLLEFSHQQIQQLEAKVETLQGYLEKTLMELDTDLVQLRQRNQAAALEIAQLHVSLDQKQEQLDEVHATQVQEAQTLATTQAMVQRLSSQKSRLSKGFWFGAIATAAFVVAPTPNWVKGIAVLVVPPAGHWLHSTYGYRTHSNH